MARFAVLGDKIFFDRIKLAMHLNTQLEYFTLDEYKAKGNASHTYSRVLCLFKTKENIDEFLKSECQIANASYYLFIDNTMDADCLEELNVKCKKVLTNSGASEVSIHKADFSDYNYTVIRDFVSGIDRLLKVTAGLPRLRSAPRQSTQITPPDPNQLLSFQINPLRISLGIYFTSATTFQSLHSTGSETELSAFNKTLIGKVNNKDFTFFADYRKRARTINAALANKIANDLSNPLAMSGFTKESVEKDWKALEKELYGRSSKRNAFITFFTRSNIRSKRLNEAIDNIIVEKNKRKK